MQGLNEAAAKRFLRYCLKNNPNKVVYRQGALELLVEATTEEPLGMEVSRESVEKMFASLMATEPWNHETAYAFSRQVLSLSSLVGEFSRPPSRASSSSGTPALARSSHGDDREDRPSGSSSRGHGPGPAPDVAPFPI